jgi:hypothetical protein
MASPRPKDKLYCYVDETGQDAASTVFVVVAVVSAEEQDGLRRALMKIEEDAGTGSRKWHKSRSERRLRYLALVLDRHIASGDVFFGCYEKPLPYFFPFIEILERAIRAKGLTSYTARVFVDGIDRQKARELTNALRLRGVSLERVKGRRDESEPVIRLADMWAGCIRAALRGSSDEAVILDSALHRQYLGNLNPLPQKGKTP